jgi:hypothetical protein
MSKTLDNRCIADARTATPDVVVFGDGDMWKLVGKASSKSEGWMKSTKAMEAGNGVLVQVSTQQGDQVAEALAYCPYPAKLEKIGEQDGRPLWAIRRS